MGKSPFLSVCVVATALACIGPVRAAAGGEVGAVTLVDADGWTRAAIDVAADAQYDVFALSNPSRLVVDVHHARLGADFRVPGPDGVVANVRAGQPVAGDVRLVFDLTAKVRPKSSIQKGPSGARLVIELRDPARKAVAAAAARKVERPAAVALPVHPPVPARDGGDEDAGPAPSSHAVDPPVRATAARAGVDGASDADSLPPATPVADMPAPTPSQTAVASVDSQTMDDDRSFLPLMDAYDRRRGASKPIEPSPSNAPADAADEAPPSTIATVPERAGARTVRDVLGDHLRPIIIAVDAGHGGQDVGAKGYSGTYEKTITLATARELARQIDAIPGLKAVLTRDGDYFVPLAERYRKAREAKADLFISVHCDAEPGHSASGSSVWVLSQRGVTSQAARWLADRENAADLVGGVKLSDKDDTLASVLLDLSQSATMKASEDAAERVHQALRDIGRTHKAHPEHANFVVLRSPDVPSMLVETAFITNQAEEQRLNNPAYRSRLARAILSGVESYFIATPLPGTRFAALHARDSRVSRVASADVAPARPAATDAGAGRRAAAPVMLATASPGEPVHVVQQGESLRDVADQYGVGLIRLREYNHLQGNQIRPGQVLRIPARSNNG